MSDEESEQQKLERALRESEPSWIATGGLRGNTPAFSVRERNQSDTVRRSDAPDGAVVREAVQPAFPATPETEEGPGKLDATVVDVYGAVDGEPALFHLFQDSPPTPVEDS